MFINQFLRDYQRVNIKYPVIFQFGYQFEKWLNVIILRVVLVEKTGFDLSVIPSISEISFQKWYFYQKQEYKVLKTRNVNDWMYVVCMLPYASFG